MGRATSWHLAHGDQLRRDRHGGRSEGSLDWVTATTNGCSSRCDGNTRGSWRGVEAMACSPVPRRQIVSVSPQAVVVNGEGGLGTVGDIGGQRCCVDGDRCAALRRSRCDRCQTIRASSSNAAATVSPGSAWMASS